MGSLCCEIQKDTLDWPSLFFSFVFFSSFFVLRNILVYQSTWNCASVRLVRSIINLSIRETKKGDGLTNYQFDGDGVYWNEWHGVSVAVAKCTWRGIFDDAISNYLCTFAGNACVRFSLSVVFRYWWSGVEEKVFYGLGSTNTICNRNFNVV